MKVIDQLRSILAGHTGEALLRGSLARGENDPNDVDVVIFGHNLSFLLNSVPATINKLPISYVVVNESLLPYYFDTRLRSCSDLIDGVSLTKIHTTPTILETYRNKLHSSLWPFYILYLWLEERIMNNVTCAQRFSHDYGVLKSLPGSKKTILRMFWILRVLYPEASGGFYEILRSFEMMGQLPIGTHLDYDHLIFNISRGRDVPSLRTRYSKWFDHILSQRVLECTRTLVGADFIKYVEIVSDSTAATMTLQVIFQYALQEKHSARQWMVLLGIASNTNTPLEILDDIYLRYKGALIYKDVIRSIIRNTSFPKSRLRVVDFANDNLAMRLYKQRG